MAVGDLAAAGSFFRDVLGGAFLMGGDQAEQGFRWIQYRWPGSKVELLAPLGDGFVARFLEARGEGVHHITYRARDLPGQVARLRAGGVALFGVSMDGDVWREAFIHPRHAHGVLIQLAESTHDDDEVARHLGLRFSEAALLAMPYAGAPERGRGEGR